MTALVGPIVFNNTSVNGDTQSSGLGPSTKVVLDCPILDGDDFSSYSVTSGNISDIQAGHLAYANTSSGTRHFNVVASVNTLLNQINFDEAWDDPALDGLTGIAVYIGGKRRTIDSTSSRRIFAHDVDQSSGYEIEIEYTGTAYTLTSVLEVASVDVIRGTGSQQPVISTSYSNDTVWEIASGLIARLGSAQLDGYTWQNLHFQSSVFRSSTARSLISQVTGASSTFSKYESCIFNGANSSYIFQTSSLSTAQKDYILEKCEFIANSSLSASTVCIYNSGARAVTVTASSFTGNTSSTAQFGCVGANGSLDVLVSCVFVGFGNLAVFGSVAGSSVVSIGCVFYDNVSALNRNSSSASIGNIFHSNTTAVSGSLDSGPILQNGYFNNSSATPATGYDFSSDPLTDPASGDFSLTTSAESEIAALSPAFGSPVVNGLPAIAFYGLSVLSGSSGGSGFKKVTMNGGIDG